MPLSKNCDFKIHQLKGLNRVIDWSYRSEVWSPKTKKVIWWKSISNIHIEQIITKLLVFLLLLYYSHVNPHPQVLQEPPHVELKKQISLQYPVQTFSIKGTYLLLQNWPDGQCASWLQEVQTPPEQSWWIHSWFRVQREPSASWVRHWPLRTLIEAAQCSLRPQSLSVEQPLSLQHEDIIPKEIPWKEYLFWM